MISNRLNQIVNFIKDDHDVADIGSDHGLLLVLLNERNFSNKALGVENKIGPYKNLERTIKSINKPNFSSNLSSGLDNVSKNYQTIVIAGMGFNNIKEIVLRDFDKGNHRETFVIDSHTNQDEVRTYFYNLGYKVDDEMIIYEDSIYYDIIRFSLNRNNIHYNSLELEFGPFNLKNKPAVFINMCNEKINKLKYVLTQISDEAKKSEIKEKIIKLEEIVDEN